MILSNLKAKIRVPKDGVWTLLIKIFGVGVSVIIGICHISLQAQNEVNMPVASCANVTLLSFMVFTMTLNVTVSLLAL